MLMSDIPMVQVRPELIPTSSPQPLEFVPVDLPQMLMSARTNEYLLRQPSGVNISNSSINVSSGGSFNIGSSVSPYKGGLSGLDANENWTLPLIGAVLLGLILLNSKRG